MARTADLRRAIDRRLRKQVLAFAERYQIPICSTLLSKSVVSELHPWYLGVYEGAMGRSPPPRLRPPG
jgi:TPP-dependent 2-oxoacid decarboxylase